MESASVFDIGPVAIYYPALMSTQLPDLADPWRLVAFGNRFAGEQTAESFPRVLEAVHSMECSVGYELNFTRDREGNAVVTGSVKAKPVMLCQRCLQPMEVAIDSSFQLGLALSEAEADRLPEELDAVVLPEQPMRILDFIEDEILISLPTVPMHEHHCAELPKAAEAVLSEVRESKPNPFAVLAGLKKNQQD